MEIIIAKGRTMILAIIERGAGTDRAPIRTGWAVPWASAAAPGVGAAKAPSRA